MAPATADIVFAIAAPLIALCLAFLIVRKVRR